MTNKKQRQKTLVLIETRKSTINIGKNKLDSQSTTHQACGKNEKKKTKTSRRHIFFFIINVVYGKTISVCFINRLTTINSDTSVMVLGVN